tara:strand:+ start:394 stop:564 length:171 start_codon:yes stop_codon:yes gene_type:complete
MPKHYGKKNGNGNGKEKFKVALPEMERKRVQTSFPTRRGKERFMIKPINNRTGKKM